MCTSANTITMDRARDVMSKNINSQDLPRVEIFWYDAGNDDLFGVVSSIGIEFNLNGQNCAFEIDTHWEVGHGWEGW